LHFKGITHLAGINMLWLDSEPSIRDSVRNAMSLAEKHGFRSIAFPLIGAGSGGFHEEESKAVTLDEIHTLDSPLVVTPVIFTKAQTD
jgi:O-acetyl-ADP-ribose deacetylase (regulator of RNase III)